MAGTGIDIEALYVRYGPMVLRRCWQLLRDETEALDLAQDVFVQLLRRRDRRSGHHPSSLLFRIATNLCLNSIRDRRKHPSLPGDEFLCRVAARDDLDAPPPRPPLWLAQTTTTQGGAQHPAYDIRMSGTGDVVMTDVRETSAGLVLGPGFDGRFFVRDGKGYLVAELHKPAGRRAEIAVEPGTYEIQYEEEKQLFAREVRVTEGERREVARHDLGPTSRDLTRLRGVDPFDGAKPFALAGRTRLEALVGGGVSSSEGVALFYTLGLLHWPRESIALEGVVTNANGNPSGPIPGPPYTTIDRSFGLSFGARYYLPPVLGRRFRPFLRATLGPVAQHKTDHDPDYATDTREYTDGTVSTLARRRPRQPLGAQLRPRLWRRVGPSQRAGAEVDLRLRPRLLFR